MNSFDMSTFIERIVQYQLAVKLKYWPLARALSEAENDWAVAVGVSNPCEVRLLEVKSMPLPEDQVLRNFAAQFQFLGDRTIGLTLGHLVLYKGGHYSERLMRHEFRHVYQWEQFPTPSAFLTEYFEQILRVGYANAPLELDARAFEHPDAKN